MPYIGDVLVSKDNANERYLKVSGLKDGQTLVLKNGDTINLKTPEDFQNGLVAAGIIDNATAASRIEKTPEFVKAKASVSPKLIK